MPVCFTCQRQIVAPSPAATYENRTYHPECLVCSKCFRSVSGKQFMKEKSGELVCEDCNAKYAPKCTKCAKVFSPGQPYKKVSESVFYHNECFVCASKCRAPIAGEFYDMEDGRFVCVDCYDKYGDDYDQADQLTNSFDNKLNLNNNNTSNRAAPPSNVQVLPAVQRDNRSNNTAPAAPASKPAASASDLTCAGCNQKLVGSYTVYNEKKYHAKCFVCVQCKKEFKEKTFFKLNDAPLCRDCHTHNAHSAASKCRKCAQPILDTVVTFKGGEFHDHCLVCNACGNKLVGQSIYTGKQEEPYCSDCYTKKEAKKCAKCSRPIAPNQTNLVFDDKNYHKECFTCKECQRQINSAESFYKSDDNEDDVVCADCVDKANEGSSF